MLDSEHEACEACQHEAVEHGLRRCLALLTNGEPCPCGRGYKSALVAEAQAFIGWAGADSWGGQVVADLLREVAASDSPGGRRVEPSDA